MIWISILIVIFASLLAGPFLLYLRSRDIDSYWKGFGEGREQGWRDAESYYKGLYISDLL